MSDDENFEEQLRQEALAKVKDEEKAVERQLGELYTDKDGTEYEWDAVKKAWFPKIDDDFIAKYQMSYGVDSETSSTTPGESENKNTTTKQYTDKDYEEYCKQYYDYYYSQNQGQNSSQHSADSTDPNYDYYSYYGYDMSEYYGPQDEDVASTEGTAEAEDENTDNKVKKKGEKRKEPPTWFEAEPDHLPNVYVSGLPTDITEQEFIDLMSKCGLIIHDHEKRKPKVKLYRTPDGAMKGDGLCCYIKPESVELALQILHESEFKGHTIHVERAKFELKGAFDPSKRKKKLSNKQKRKLKERQEKLFSWTPEKKEFSRGKNEKVVILQHVFDPKEFEHEPTLINEIRADMRSECIKFGEVRKVTVHDRNPDGTVSIFFKSPEEADQCISALNGRWFAGRQLSAFTWDGKTKYDLEETEEERAKRLKEWEQYLETGEEAATSQTKVLASDTKPDTSTTQEDSTKTTSQTDENLGASSDSSAETLPVAMNSSDGTEAAT